MGPASIPELPPSRRIRYGYPLALLALALSLVLVVMAWSHMRERELAAAAEQFRARAGQQAVLMQLHLDNVELTLRGGASLFTAVEEPSPQHWRGYVEGLQLDTRFPYLLGLGYAAFTDRSGLVRLQESWREAGHGLLQVRPHGLRDHYAVILFVEPGNSQNGNARGFDMWSEATRRETMRAAMDSGRPRLSASIVLMRDQGSERQSMVLFTPIYAAADAPNTPHARRASLRGWVFAPFRIDTLLQATVAARTQSTIRLRIVDTSGPGQQVLYRDAGIGGTHAFTHSLSKSFYGRTWRFDFFSGPQHDAAPQLAAVDRLLYAGLAGCLLLFALAWMLASTEARARKLASVMTESSRRSEQRFRNAMQYSAIGKALLDSNSGIIEWNPAFAQIVGRAANELEGVLLNDLLGDDAAPLDTAQMQAFDEEGSVVRLTRSLQRGDGETRYVQLTFAPVPADPGIDIARLVQVEDVTDRMQAEAAVQALNRTLEARVAARTRELSEANRELESFAYSVSHDLRAPLRGIEGFSRLLGERHASGLDETGRDYLERVRKGTARMGELIDALLKLSRLGRAEADLEDVDMSDLAEQVVAELREAEPDRDVGVSIQAGMHAVADRSLARTLLDNLIGNAWKFTRGAPAAQVTVSGGAAADGRTWFEVRDNGAGFDPDYANKLFKPFQRLHAQGDFPGHGIGLASVKRIVERHGGEITAEGEVGKGAAFRFTLSASSETGTPGAV